MYKKCVFLFFACFALWHCLQTGYSHYVPDDAGTIRAGRDALCVITLDFHTSNSAFVLFHSLQQTMAMRLQLPNTHLKHVSKQNSFSLLCVSNGYYSGDPGLNSMLKCVSP